MVEVPQKNLHDDAVTQANRNDDEIDKADEITRCCCHEHKFFIHLPPGPLPHSRSRGWLGWGYLRRSWRELSEQVMASVHFHKDYDMLRITSLTHFFAPLPPQAKQIFKCDKPWEHVMLHPTEHSGRNDDGRHLGIYLPRHYFYTCYFLLAQQRRDTSTVPRQTFSSQPSQLTRLNADYVFKSPFSFFTFLRQISHFFYLLQKKYLCKPVLPHYHPICYICMPALKTFVVTLYIWWKGWMDWMPRLDYIAWLCSWDTFF